MDNIKRFKKGEFVFKEGDSSQYIYIIQTGRLALNVDRGGKKLEVTQLGTSQIIGEQALFSNAKQAFTAEAMQECKVMEVPVELLKGQFEKSPPGIKLLVKSLVDEVRQSRHSLRSLKMETEKSPCPQVSIPRIFSLLNLVARHTGKAAEGRPHEIDLDWGVLKLYTARLFAESPQRMRSLIDLLSKTGHASFEVRKSEEGEEELVKIKLFNVQFIEEFAEFYQYNLYKGGKSEVIYVDPLALKVSKVLTTLAVALEPDRRGAVSLEYESMIANAKKQFRLELKNTHWDLLERKGLFVKRSSSDAGVFLQFDKAEFEKTQTYWSIIHEIDKWNEKGFVDLNEKEEHHEEGAESCPQCSGPIQEVHKFCPSCGFKLAA